MNADKVILLTTFRSFDFVKSGSILLKRDTRSVIMSQQKETKKATVANMKLKKMVDWKIFELQSILVSDDVDEESVNESILWFQPRHFSEVVEERINDGKCGYPLCSHPLDDQNNASYRINYAEKKIYSIELSSRYHCVACIQKAQLLEKKFDDSVPYSRSVIKTLDLTATIESNIDDVLNLLTPHSTTTTKTNTSLHSTLHSTIHSTINSDLPPPPAYQSSVLSHTGDLPVQFLDGLPVLAGTTNSSSPSEHVNKQARYEESDFGTTDSDVGVGVGVEMDMDRQSPDGSGGSGSNSSCALHREVFHSREMAATEDAGLNTTQNNTPSFDTRPTNTANHNTSINNTPSVTNTNTNTNTSTNTNTNTNKTTNIPGASMAEMFATMNALRIKHNLANPSTTPTTHATVGGGTRFTNGSLLEKTPTSVKKDILPTSTNSTTTTTTTNTTTATTTTTTAVRTGTMGRRPGAKNVRWGANSSTNIDNTASVDSMNINMRVAESVESSSFSTDTSVPSTVRTDVRTVAVAPVSVPDVVPDVVPDAVPVPVIVSAPPAPIIKQIGAGGVPVIKEKEVTPLSGGKRTTVQLTGQVTERVNPRPMSAAAMMRKREDVSVDDSSIGNSSSGISGSGGKMQRHMLGSASSGAILKSIPINTKTTNKTTNSTTTTNNTTNTTTTNTNNSMYDRDDFDRGDDEGEQWVDVDPSELLALGYTGPGSVSNTTSTGANSTNANSTSAELDNAMSIEGYIANVKKSIRVSPATTIKNLSHSPYTYHDINHLVNAAHSDNSKAEPMDVNETDAPSDEDAEINTQGSDDVEEMWDTEDENDTESAPFTSEPEPTQSLFLTVWGTMDELFGTSLDQVFHEQGAVYGESAALERVTPVQLVNEASSAPEPTEASRPPIALEQQNAQHAFVKLLQRGIHTAESQLSLTSLVLTLHEERLTYASIKHKLLNTANNTLQRRNNLNSSSYSSSNAGTGLHSAGWTLIGLLVIDAVVTKRQFGPLRRKKPAHTQQAQNDALTTRDVSAESWNQLIEQTATDVLYSATTRKNSNLMKLREGDLQILRSYFDYI